MNYGKQLLLTTATIALLSAVGAGSGYAADLGGGCCGDLEERIAELEATTARKGNRVVSLEISGQVNRALLIWDDGVKSDAYIVDPDSDGSRFRFTGKAKIKPGWEAGYIMEITTIDSASNQVDQFNDEGPAQPINIRQNGWYIDSERLGRISVGQLSQPTDGINEIDAVGTYTTVAKTHYAGHFLLETDGAPLDPVAGLRWENLLGAIGGTQDDIVRYDSPSIYGFIVSAAWGDNDVFDIALHFEKQFNSVKVVAGIGYLDDQEGNLTADLNHSNNHHQLSGSISAQHVPTGLFATFAAGRQEFDDSDLSDAENWYLKGGISRNWFGYGATTLFVDYAHFNGFGEGQTFNLDGAGGRNDTLTSTEASVWGFGVVQSFDSAALNIYALAQFFNADVRADQTIGGLNSDVQTEDHMAIVIGSHIKF